MASPWRTRSNNLQPNPSKPMSNDWLEQRKKDAWRWDRLTWPRGLNDEAQGEYRVLEMPQYGEQAFIPQWRRRDPHSWQSWMRVTWGRCGSEQNVSFATIHEAKAWLDEAHKNRPRFRTYEYQPA